jgi:heat shock protein HtpX
LFAEIDRIAAATGQAPPRHVYAVLGVEAFVSQRGGVLGFRARRIMGIGLALLEAMNLGEFRAILAHEFGHFYSGDTKLGAWIYRTRSAIGRTMLNLQDAAETAAETSETLGVLFLFVRAPFSWFANLFLRSTQAISRAQELSADALAARVVGKRALCDGLEKAHAGAVAFDAFCNNELAPILDAGLRTPVIDGYRLFTASEFVATRVAENLEQELNQPTVAPFDSHPPLRERLAAVEGMTEATSLDSTQPAITLLDDLLSLEARLLPPRMNGRPRELISWEDVGNRVHAPTIRREFKRFRKAFAGITPLAINGELTWLRMLAEGGFRTSMRDADREHLLGGVRDMIELALCKALADRHFEVFSEPGARLYLHSGDLRFDPVEEVRAYLDGDLDHATWSTRMRDLGIADVDLGHADEAPRRKRPGLARARSGRMPSRP